MVVAVSACALVAGGISGNGVATIGGLALRLLVVLACTTIYSTGWAESPAAPSTENNTSVPASGVFGQNNNSGSFGRSKTLLGQQAGKPAFLSATQAFQFTALQAADKVIIQANVVPGHYLYQQRFAVQASSGLTVGKISFNQQPEFENDPEFGRVPVFHQDVSLTVPVQGSGTLTLNWQGCAKAGVCYPPEQFQTRIINAKPATKTDTQKDKASSVQANAKADIATAQTNKTQPAVPATPAITSTNNAKAQTALENKTNVKVTALGDAPPIVATPLPEMPLRDWLKSPGDCSKKPVNPALLLKKSSKKARLTRALGYPDKQLLTGI
jgi:thioredoxin:protein disulfide reductase